MGSPPEPIWGGSNRGLSGSKSTASIRAIANVPTGKKLGAYWSEEVDYFSKSWTQGSSSTTSATVSSGWSSLIVDCIRLAVWSSGTADGVALAAEQVVRAASRPLDALFWHRWTKCVRRAWWQQAQGEPVSNVVASGWPQQPTLVAPATRCCVALLAPFFCFAAFRLVFCSNFCS